MRGAGYRRRRSTHAGATAPCWPPQRGVLRTDLNLKVFYSSRSSAVCSRIRTPHPWATKDGPEPLLLATSGESPFSAGTAGASSWPRAVWPTPVWKPGRDGNSEPGLLCTRAGPCAVVRHERHAERWPVDLAAEDVRGVDENHFSNRCERPFLFESFEEEKLPRNWTGRHIGRSGGRKQCAGCLVGGGLSPSRVWREPLGRLKSERQGKREK